MDTTQIKSLRAELVANVNKNADHHRNILADIERLTAEAGAAETTLRASAEELRNFDSVFGKRLVEAGETLAQPGTPTDAPKVTRTAAKPAAAKERTAGLKGNGSKRTVAQAAPKSTTKKPATTVKRAAAKKPETKAAKTKSGGEAKTKNGGAKKGGATKKSGTTRALLGRRAVASGERPSIKEAIRTVMGNKVMSAQEVYEGLKEKGWLPNAKEPRTHVGHVLSSLSDVFHRVPERGRGFYRIASANGSKRANGSQRANGSKRAANGSKRATAAANGSKRTNGSKRATAAANGSKRAAANGSKRTAPASNGSKRSETDDILAQAGINVPRRSTEATVT